MGPGYPPYGPGMMGPPPDYPMNHQIPPQYGPGQVPQHMGPPDSHAGPVWVLTPRVHMRSTSEGSNLNPESSIFVPGVWREAQAPIRNAYVDRDLQGTNSHAHPENTQLSEPMASTSNLASGHGDQTSSAAGNTERVYVGYVVRKTPTSSAESSTRKRALPESPGGYELAEAQDSSSAAAAPALPNSEIDNSQTGKSKETTPPMSSAQDSDINEKSQKDNGKGRGKGKDKATETTRPMSHPGVEVREKSQEGRPSGSTATTFNLETIAEIDRDPIRTRKPSNVPGNETEDEDEGNSGSVHVGSAGEGVNNGDPSSSTRPTKKRRRKKKSSQPTQKIEEAANEETVNEETANEETSAKEEEAMKEQTKLCYNEFIALENIANLDGLEHAQKLIFILLYHQFLWKAHFELSEPQQKELWKKLAPREIQNTRYHFTEVVYIAISLATSAKGRQLLKEAVEKTYPPDILSPKQNIDRLCFDIRETPLFSDWDWIENSKENSEPLYWYWFCRKAAPRIKSLYQKLGRERAGFDPSDSDDPWKLLTLHLYTPESPLCSPSYPFTEAAEAAVPNGLKAFVASANHSNPRDWDKLFEYWSQPHLSHIRRLYIQQHFPIGERPRRTYSSSIPSAQSSCSEETPPKKDSAMAPHTLVSLPLPVLPGDWSSEKDFKAIASLSAATQRSIEPVGPHFLAHARRARHKRTFSEDDRIQAQENVKKVEDDDSGEISEPEDPMMLSRDAKDWKSQDHYAVLGLSKYRYKATEEQIKRAHRKKVLRHHPDKKAAAGSTEDDNFFKCIQKAHEILLDPVKRRQFDSVDEHADVEPPTKKQLKDGKFYKLWSNVFKAEGRFSNIQPVPKFGDENTSEEEVINFYNFFYNFDSWRSFEYQDEDVPDDNENRDQKRHVEKKNNNARKKKKLEDTARLRKLVETAEATDLRIKKFKAEASALKNKKRLEKEAADRKAAEDAKAAKEAEAKAAKEAEEKAKVEKEQSKKAKEAAKAAVKKNRRVLKGSIKEANYFANGDASAEAINSVSNDVDLVTGKIDPDETAALAAKLSGLKVAGEIKGVWVGEVKRLVEAGKIKAGEVKTLA